MPKLYRLWREEMRRLLIPLILFTLILAACQSSTPVATEITSETETVQNTAAPTHTIVNTEIPRETEPPTEEVASTDSPPPGCTVISPKPTPGPTQQSLFPPAGEEDWITGPNDAAITIIEYGDFQ